MEASQWKKLSNQLKLGSRQLLTWTENVVRPCSTEVMHDSHDEFAAGALCGFDVSYQLARGHSTVRGGFKRLAVFQPPLFLIMAPKGKNMDGVIVKAIDQAIFLRESARPQS